MSNGLDRITTIQIADRAGVSVGTLYQFFPNKRALLAAIVKRHVGEVVDVTIEACKSAHGKSIGEMCGSIVGPTRAVIEAGGNRDTFDRLKNHLTALGVVYLKEVRS